MKNILVIHYSQSGQLTEILDNLLLPVYKADDITITSLKLEMEEAYPFPWSKPTFFDVFPESFLQIEGKLKPIPQDILNKEYDLIVLGYQVWYLSPSIPTNTFLKLPEAKKLLEDTPVVTVIGCRNMWIMAQEKVKMLLKENKARLVGNIALVDRHINHISVITIVQWMFSGKKKKYLGVFPKPGVSDKDIKESSKFGQVLLNSIRANNGFNELQSNLLDKGAVLIKPFLILADKRANILFGKWAKLIYSKGAAKSEERKPWLKLFNFYLLFAIWIIAPVVFILFLLAYVPFYKQIKRSKQYYSSIELK